MYNKTLPSESLAAQAVQLSKSEVIVLTFQDDVELEAVRNTLECWAKAFPYNKILANFPCLVKSMTVIDVEKNPHQAFKLEDSNEFINPTVKEVFDF